MQGLHRSYRRSGDALVQMSAKAPVLKANDGLAAEAAVAKLFEQLARAVQFNHRADARSDRAVRKHVRDLVQPLRR